MALRLAGEEFSVLQGLDALGWLREVVASDGEAGLRVDQQGAGDIVDLLDNGTSVFKISDGGPAVLGCDLDLAGQSLKTSSGDLTLDPAGKVKLSKLMQMGPNTELTIAAGVIAVTGSLHGVDTEGDAATDDLDTINGGANGDVLFLHTMAAARVVVLKHGTGNIFCDGSADISLNNSNVIAMLIFGPNNQWHASRLVGV